MRPVPLAVLWSLLGLSVSAAAAARTIADHPDVRAIFSDLLRNGWYGMLDTESAAFITIDARGRYDCVEWRYTGKTRAQTWRGDPPPFTVAIAHTHPKGSRHPSRGDLATAKATGIPIFVLTPTNIYLATPEGKTVTIVEKTAWAKVSAPRGPCRDAAPTVALSTN